MQAEVGSLAMMRKGSWVVEEAIRELGGRVDAEGELGGKGSWGVESAALLCLLSTLMGAVTPQGVVTLHGAVTPQGGDYTTGRRLHHMAAVTS